jgi:hypothetical protein
LPSLLVDIEAILREGHISAAKMRRRLIVNANYPEASLPTVETIRKKMKVVRASIAGRKYH